jgi:cytochrome b561
VPLAVGSSIIGRVLVETFGLPQGAWFQIHRGLNMIAAILTLVAFAIAFYLINQLPGAKHFFEITHHFIGLVIFVLTLLQAGAGIFRPHLPHTPEPDDEQSVADEEAAVEKTAEEPAKKSTLRIMWEYGHRIVGVVLLAMAWWQVQNGLGLFAQRFDTSDLKGVFFAVIGVIVGAVVVLRVYQACKLDKKEQPQDEVTSHSLPEEQPAKVEKKEQTREVVMDLSSHDEEEQEDC